MWRRARARLRRLSAPIAPSYTPGCRFHGRGLQHFDRKLLAAGLPDLATQIEQRLHEYGSCRVLEVGCGEGRLLLDLRARFGAKLELHGLNVPAWSVMRGELPLLRTNEHYQILRPLRLLALGLPTIHAADVERLESFPVRNFDLIVSQAVIPHVVDKARALEQTARLLSADGTFLHELDCLDLPPSEFPDRDLPRFSIYRGADRVSTSEQLRTSGIELLDYDCRGVAGVLAVYRPGPRELELGLRLDRRACHRLRSSVRPGQPSHVWGMRSVYHLPI